MMLSIEHSSAYTNEIWLHSIKVQIEEISRQMDPTIEPFNSWIHLSAYFCQYIITGIICVKKVQNKIMTVT